MTPIELKRIRKKLEMTQADLAKALDVPLATVARWETGMAIRHGRILKLALKALEAKL